MLRCRYTQHNNQWQQIIPTTEAIYDDFGWAKCHTTEAELSQHLARLHTQLSLTQGPLFGVLLIHLDTLPDQPRLYLINPHVVIDLVSWRILIDDLNTLLTHQPLPPKTLSFAQWVTSLEAHAATLSADCWPEQIVATNPAELTPVDQAGTRHFLFQTLDTDLADRLLLNIAFDVCIAEVLATFLAGGTVVPSTFELLHDPFLVNTCYLTCSLLSAVDPLDNPNLTTAVSTSEALTSRVGQQWSTLFNFYGPSEAAILSHYTAHDGTQMVHIDQPILNTQTYSVDDCLQLVLIGVPDQVCIAGAGIGNGYWKRPELTSKTLIDNPFGPGKLYLTGDLGCWLPNGNIKIWPPRPLSQTVWVPH
ncbi:hypothetical protein H4R35_004926 [Dimargaris xerosporica]|nr:hypothetical protein H4R35_004926 [Dimargaris xerosporica]